MPAKLVLASSSHIRAAMLRNAGLTVDARPVHIDEDMIRASLAAKDTTSRDVADTLAELKARRVSAEDPQVLVIGCDQVLDCQGRIYSKPESAGEARDQIRVLSGRSHRLYSAVAVVRDGEPLWRHVGVARLTMRALSESYLDDYVRRNWGSIRHSVGGYKLEEEGVRLFSRIEGDYFTILGLPLIELLTWLSIRGDITT